MERQWFGRPPNATALGGEPRKLTASSDAVDEGDYAIVQVTFENGKKGCGWIPYEDYEAAMWGRRAVWTPTRVRRSRIRKLTLQTNQSEEAAG